MSVQHLAACLGDAQRRAHISVAAELEMGLKQQALHLTPFGLLLRLNLMEREVQGGWRRQPSLQRSEFEGGGSGYASDGSGPHRGRRRLPFPGREWSEVARRKRLRRNWSYGICY